MLSVVMTTYNGEKYLAEQLDSILHQSRMVDEIVVCDDVSTDSTYAILSHYATQFPIIKVYKNESRLGVNTNFIHAFSLSHGDIIFPCDQDDIWYPTKVEVLLDNLDLDSDIVYAKDRTITDESTESELNITSDCILSPDNQIYRNLFCGHTCAFRHSLLELYNHSGCMSWDYVLSMYASFTMRYAYVNVPLMDWRRHKSAVTYEPVADVSVTIPKIIKCSKHLFRIYCVIETLFQLFRGRISQAVKEHFAARSVLVMYLKANFKLVTTNNQTRALMLILKQLAAQTPISFVCASFTTLYYYMTDGKFNLRKLLWGMRRPFVEWFLIRNERYLG